MNPQGHVRKVIREGDALTITAANGSQILYRAMTPTTFHAERGDAYAVFGRDILGAIAFLEILQPTSVDRLTRRRSPP